MNRRNWFRNVGLLGAAVALAPTKTLGQIVVNDPAVFSAELRNLAQQFITNKNQLSEIMLLLDQWNSIVTDHHMNISMLWTDMAPYLDQLDNTLASQGVVANNTKNIYDAMRNQIPQYDPNAPVPWLIGTYEDYMRRSTRAALMVVQQQDQNLKSQDVNLGNLRKKAVDAQGQHDYFLSQYMIAEAGVNATNSLHYTLGTFIDSWAGYMAAQAEKEASTEKAGRTAIANALALNAQSTVSQGQPTTQPQLVVPKAPTTPVMPNS